MIKIYPSYIIFRQDNSMICRHFLDSVDRHCPFLVELVQIKNVSLLTHFNKFHKNLCRTLGVIYCPVMVLQRYTHSFCHCIQLKPVQLWKEESGHSYSIHNGIISVNSQVFIILFDKTHIKTGIVGHHHCPLAELFKFRQYLVDSGRVLYHTVIDAGKLLDPERNGNLWIHKLRKPVCDFSILHPDSADLYDFIFHGRKTRSLYIKDHIGSLKGLALAVVYDSFQIVYQISLHAIDHLKI